MRHTFFVAFCLFLFLSIDILACQGQSEPKAITIDYSENDEDEESVPKLAFRVFTYDLERLEVILKLSNCDENKLLYDIAERVLLFKEGIGSINLQDIYNAQVSLAQQMPGGLSIEAATLVAIYDPGITLKKDFVHGIWFRYDRLLSFFPINFLIPSGVQDENRY